jgi:site-specific recombinase XerD
VKFKLAAPGRLPGRRRDVGHHRAAKTISLRHNAVCLILATMGLRADELAKARWLDVYSDSGKRLGLALHGKGSKDRQLRFTARAWELIVALHGGKRNIDPKDESPLIPTHWGTRPSRTAVWQWVKDAVNAAVKMGTLQKSTASSHLFRPATPRSA